MPVGEVTGVQAYTLQGRKLPHRDAGKSTDRRGQVLCDFYRQNGIDMNATGIPGKSNVRK